MVPDLRPTAAGACRELMQRRIHKDAFPRTGRQASPRHRARRSDANVSIGPVFPNPMRWKRATTDGSGRMTATDPDDMLSKSRAWVLQRGSASAHRSARVSPHTSKKAYRSHPVNASIHVWRSQQRARRVNARRVVTPRSSSDLVPFCPWLSFPPSSVASSPCAPSLPAPSPLCSSSCPAPTAPSRWRP